MFTCSNCRNASATLATARGLRYLAMASLTIASSHSYRTQPLWSKIQVGRVKSNLVRRGRQYATGYSGRRMSGTRTVSTVMTARTPPSG